MVKVENINLSSEIIVNRYTGSFLLDSIIAFIKQDNNTLKFNLLCIPRGIYRIFILDFKRKKYLSKKDKEYCANIKFSEVKNL